MQSGPFGLIRSFALRTALPSLALWFATAVTSSSAGGEDLAAWSELIDRRLGERQAAAGVRAAPLIEDGAFLRRVSLDLIGRVPTVAETREFLADRGAGKDRELVRRLIGSPAFARHWATIWRRRWIPEADAPQFEFLADDADEWLTAKLRARTPHDRLVAQLLVGVETDEESKTGRSGARAFLVAGEDKPENLAAHATRAFLGVNLDCAQCHDHPFARWTRDQFWETAAFFARPTVEKDASPRFTSQIPETERVVDAKFLATPAPAWPATHDRDSGRRVWAQWAASPENPFFARHAVNTIWAQLLGHGLVEPLDDLSATDPQGDPKLLDDLARRLIAGRFDTAQLIEACVLTDAYRRAHTGATRETASVSKDETQGATSSGDIDRFLFAEGPVRALTGEQAYDSLRTAAGLPVLRDDLARREAVSERRAFGRRFLTDRPAAAERSILQALELMNGRTVVEATDPDRSPLVIAAAEGPLESTADRIELIFLATLAREPSADELTAY
jgi:hypothetical protein